MSASSPSGLIKRATDYDTLGALLFGGIGGVLLAGFEQTIAFILTATRFILTPLQVFTQQLGEVIIAFVGGAAEIILQGAGTSIASLAPGGWAAIGPFTFAGAIGAAALGLGVMAFILSLSPTSDLIPFSFTDVPLLGVDEDEEQLSEED